MHLMLRCLAGKCSHRSKDDISARRPPHRTTCGTSANETLVLIPEYWTHDVCNCLSASNHCALLTTGNIDNYHIPLTYGSYPHGFVYMVFQPASFPKCEQSYMASTLEALLLRLNYDDDDNEGPLLRLCFFQSGLRGNWSLLVDGKITLREISYRAHDSPWRLRSL
jgi:hypothetical protein